MSTSDKGNKPLLKPNDSWLPAFLLSDQSWSTTPFEDVQKVKKNILPL